MFVGHYAVALAAKPAAPKTAFGTLVLAALLSDTLWIVFIYAGVEHVAIKPGITAVNALDLYDFPYSHSLLANVVWAVFFAGVYFLLRRDKRATGVILAAVISHWLLDFISHRPDMPLAPGVHKLLGLGLWYSRSATLLVEGCIWLAGVILYIRSTRPTRRVGTYGFWIMVSLITALWLLSLRGDPPPNLDAVIITNMVMFAITLAWAYWIDTVRTVNAAGVENAKAAIP
jgi:hypothetical protein